MMTIRIPLVALFLLALGGGVAAQAVDRSHRDERSLAAVSATKLVCEVVDGDLTVGAIGGDCRFHTVDGEVEVEGCAALVGQTVDGRIVARWTSRASMATSS